MMRHGNWIVASPMQRSGWAISLKCHDSFAKEPYKHGIFFQKRPSNLGTYESWRVDSRYSSRGLLIVWPLMDAYLCGTTRSRLTHVNVNVRVCENVLGASQCGSIYDTMCTRTRTHTHDSSTSVCLMTSRHSRHDSTRHTHTRAHTRTHARTRTHTRILYIIKTHDLTAL